MGSRSQLLATCLEIVQNGSPSELYEVIPHIRILRAEELLEPLIQLLESEDSELSSAAATALGSLGDEKGVARLRSAYFETSSPASDGTDSFPAAIIAALGEIPSALSVEALLEIFELEKKAEAEEPIRRELVVSALGQLAQQEVKAAETELFHLLDSPEILIQKVAITELCLAYWHRPSAAPTPLLERVFKMILNGPIEISSAAAGSLASLSQLGSQRAEELMNRLLER